MDFYFKITKKKSKDTLIIAKNDEIFEINFRAAVNETIFKTVVKFKRPLESQPRFFIPNYDQTIFMIASGHELKYINRKT